MPCSLGECQRFPVVGMPAFGIELVRMGRDVAEQVQRMGRKAGLALRGFNRTICLGAAPRRAGRAADRRAPPRGRPSRDDRRFPAPPDARGAARPPGPGFNASLASPIWASAQAEEATAQGRGRRHFQLRDVFDPRVRPVSAPSPSRPYKGEACLRAGRPNRWCAHAGLPRQVGSPPLRTWPPRQICRARRGS